MKVRMILISFLGYLVSGSVSLANVSESLSQGTLCLVSEDVYFSCKLKNSKVVSVCGSITYPQEGYFTPNDGYVQYRYGSINNVELEYPENKVSPINKFTLIINDMSKQFAHDNGVAWFNTNKLKFNNGSFQYVLTSSKFGSNELDNAFLDVYKNGENIFSQECQMEVTSNFFELYRYKHRFDYKTKIEI
ncbi:hypothetical protein [uncultured Photobacterium sp.]|uniref:hypothetical protein n=1 Tax=uncultured Photobacterium sp. TaxID=173973 RepID=UPI00262316D0|nr:hypothetical protein [uncultured Photobacterium sp.]